MELINLSNANDENNIISTQPIQVIVEANQMPDIVLKRLMEEVKNDITNNIFAYDRAHNRHNRGR